MVAIINKFNAAKAAFEAQANTFGAAVKNGVSKAGQVATKGTKAAGIVLTNPQAQRDVFGKIRSGVDSLYTRVSTATNSANKTLETEGEALLRAPIKAMKELTITRLSIKETDSTNAKAAKKAVNAITNYHEKVVRIGERISRQAGDKAHAFTSLALTPVRFIAKLLQVEVAGALIQNSIALAVGFAVRGLVLALSQLGHLVPYLAAAAVAGGVGLGLSLLAVKISPLAAVAVGIGLIMLGQQAQISILSRDVNKLANAIRADRQKAANSTLTARAKQFAALLAKGVTVPASLAVKHKGKVATAAALGAAATAAYYYGVPAVVTETLSKTGAYLASFFQNPVEERITSKAPGIFATVMGLGSDQCPALETIDFDRIGTGYSA